MMHNTCVDVSLLRLRRLHIEKAFDPNKKKNNNKKKKKNSRVVAAGKNVYL